MTIPNATEREIAREIAPAGAGMHFNGNQLRKLIAQALADRREACARKADGFTCGLCGMDGKAGAAIRNMQD